MNYGILLAALGVVSSSPGANVNRSMVRDNSGRLGGFNRSGDFGKALVPGTGNTRVVNGVSVAEGGFKFAASLKLTNNAATYITCTGSLIADNVILTAAHCLYKSHKKVYSPDAVTIGLGDIHSVDGGNPNLYYASKLVPHPKYRPNALLNDLGLIFLKSKVSSNIAKPIEIYTGKVTDDISLEAAGWGVIDNEDTQTTVLQKVPLVLGDSSACKSAYQWWSSNDGRTVCTEVVDSQDTCYGDSGGPLVTGSVDAPALVGLTSFGDDLDPTTGQALCGVNGGVGFYTHAKYYKNWIDQEINNNNRSGRRRRRH